jgi:hypothetical protein
MCDDLVTDCDCDDDCCCNDSSHCCVDCCHASPSSATATDSGEATSGFDNGCLYYLCCAGCFLCPIFYVGYKDSNPSNQNAAPGIVVEAPASQLNKDHSEGATFKTSTTTDHTGTAALISTTMVDTEKLDVVDRGAIQASTPMQRM